MIRNTMFKAPSDMDIVQTDGRELPTLGVEELTGDVENYAAFFCVNNHRHSRWLFTQNERVRNRVVTDSFLVETKRIELSTLRMRTVRSPS